MAAVRVSVRIDLPGGRRIGARKIALLEAIHAQGSISAAARAIGMTYRSAWQWVEEINGALREPAVTAKIGGRKGGGAVLTSVGTQIVGLYEAVEASAQLAADAELRAIQALARHGKL
jgi:molybdate transport system regulatory protein